MKNLFQLTLLLISCFSLFAQSNNTVYGIIRQNYFSTVTNPFDSSTYEVLDSTSIQLGSVDPNLGIVTNIGPEITNELINLTGAALNPYNSTYICLGANKVNSFDLINGGLSNQVPLYNPLGNCYFDNFRFNNSDSSVYGLSRRTYLNTTTNRTEQGMFLAILNTQTGFVNEISTSSIAPGFTLSGSAIDPYQMVYYFNLGNNLIGVDMFTGNIYSNVALTITDGFAFGNFTYSCADTAIYGLVRQNYFTTVYDSLIMDSTEKLDSATVKLGRVNPATGIVTNISSGAAFKGGYTVNGGASIDPDNMVYYYSTGTAIQGISLLTGLSVSSSSYVFTAGQYFDLMRNTENCIAALPARFKPVLTTIEHIDEVGNYALFPNPTSDFFQLSSDEHINIVELRSIEGKLIQQTFPKTNTVKIDMSNLPFGVYQLTWTNTQHQTLVKKVVKK